MAGAHFTCRATALFEHFDFVAQRCRGLCKHAAQLTAAHKPERRTGIERKRSFHNNSARKPLPLGRGGSADLLSKLSQKCGSLFEKRQFFRADASGKPSSIKRSDVEGTR